MFYPDSGHRIREILNDALEREKPGIDAIRFDGHIAGGVVPHAGLAYCAPQAVHFFEQHRRWGRPPDTVLIVHPNHGGQGPGLSVDGHRHWETPMGSLAVDIPFMESLGLPVSPRAQESEHSAEVILPYLQYFFSFNYRILAVNIRDQDAATAIDLANKIHRVSKHMNRKLLFIASSDFSHFLSPERAMERDSLVLQKILSRDTKGVHKVVTGEQITVCGYGPIMALMEYTRLLDPGYRVHVLRRGHSGEASPSDRVVSYVSLLFEFGSD